MRRKQYCINFKFAVSLNAGFKMKYVIEKKVIISLTQPILKIEKEMKKNYAFHKKLEGYNF